jgi:hypothetical protein
VICEARGIHGISGRDQSSRHLGVGMTTGRHQGGAEGGRGGGGKERTAQK